MLLDLKCEPRSLNFWLHSINMTLKINMFYSFLGVQLLKLNTLANDSNADREDVMSINIQQYQIF